MIEKGVIVKISEIEQAGSGFKFNYHLQRDIEHNSLLILEYYNKDIKYLNDFINKNKVGDVIEIEFNIKCVEGVNKNNIPYTITKLLHWKIIKLFYEYSLLATSRD